MRLRRKPNLEQRMQRCADAGMLIKNPEDFKGKWNESFAAKEIYLELGCGKGRFTVFEAQDSNALFLAIEKNADALVIAMERAIDSNAENIRFVNGRIEDIDKYFDSHEMDCIYINFCDPWPSTRHMKRRLTYRAFVEKYSRIMKPGGELRFKTDNEALFNFSLKEFVACGYIIRQECRNLHENGAVGIMTDYEEKYHTRGVPVFFCAAVNSENNADSVDN